jgi:hypothetical protein
MKMMMRFNFSIGSAFVNLGKPKETRDDTAWSQTNMVDL